MSSMRFLQKACLIYIIILGKPLFLKISCNLLHFRLKVLNTKTCCTCSISLNYMPKWSNSSLISFDGLTKNQSSIYIIDGSFKLKNLEPLMLTVSKHQHGRPFRIWKRNTTVRFDNQHKLHNHNHYERTILIPSGVYTTLVIAISHSRTFACCATNYTNIWKEVFPFNGNPTNSRSQKKYSVKLHNKYKPLTMAHANYSELIYSETTAIGGQMHNLPGYSHTKNCAYAKGKDIIT